MQELVTRLEALCQAQGAGRFSADEIVELLEDGEEVDWIVTQVMPDATEENRSELIQILNDIAREVAPPSAVEEEQDSEATTEVAEAEVEAETEAEAEDLDLGELREMLPPGVDMRQVEQMLSSPRGALLADFSAFCQERGVGDEGDEAEMSDAMRELHDEWLQTPREALEGKRPAEALEGGRLFPDKIETFRRETPKVGRNDPCPCGSGKKFKKCCGKAA